MIGAENRLMHRLRTHAGRAAMRLCARPLAGVLALAGVLLIPACESETSRQDALAVTPFSAVPSARAWVRAPAGVMVMQRGRGAVREQRILLPNATTVAGDNLLHLWLERTSPDHIPVFRLDRALERAGGVPPPFAGISDAELKSREDELGVIHWAEERRGASTLCVLALRRVDVSQRPLPGGATLMDVVLRHCVDGPLEAALAPIGPDRIGYVAGGPLGRLAPSPRNISPFAAPVP